MNKIKPLDQVCSLGRFTPNHVAKLQNKFEFQGTILSELLKFASSVPDFRRLYKGNIKHRLSDIIMLLILGRASKCVGRAEIIQFAKSNLRKFQKLGMFRNGIPS